MDHVLLIDAIAENINLKTVINRLEEINPDIVVTISGFECIEEDMVKLSGLKVHFPQTTFILFGHYATHFPKEILESVPVDYILLEEPDIIFSELYDCLKEGGDVNQVKGIAYKSTSGDIVIQPGTARISDPNMLPMPAYDLMVPDYYHEWFLPKPFGLIQTARGCPYQCNYCVKSFGTKLTMMEPERIIRDIQYLIDQFSIKSLRFIDDTFTAIPKRVIKVCQLMVERNIKIQWTCLSRVDTVNEEMIKWMKKAGCKRIYFGVESGSQRILNHFKKGVADIDKTIDNLLLCRKHGIETGGFFIIGFPIETEEDFNKSLSYAIRSKLNFITVSELTPYPGTPLFSLLKEQIHFSILPYRNEFKDKEFYHRYSQLEARFYRKFYLRPAYFVQNFSVIIANLGEIIKAVGSLAAYMWKNKSMGMPKFKEVNTKETTATFSPY